MVEASGARCAIIFTALGKEFEAAKRFVKNPEKHSHPLGTVYEVGHFNSNGNKWKIALVQTGKYEARAAAETVRAIEYFHPSIAIFVGVAGGIKDVNVGDVVVADMVLGYEYGKEERTFLPRRESFHSTYRLRKKCKISRKKPTVD